ncbi:copper-binding protein [Kitasatospora griseola]|uniref:copper-binding protein n=1 Tax=Kitasatospora griseola TaxID=2064 RepID=UPI00167140DE|nr:copper-binding protein [Kitasatospora griseola]GGQ53344.1 hypothetical protein GCM10010195_05690 [Kitasatospora griseola]
MTVIPVRRSSVLTRTALVAAALMAAATACSSNGKSPTATNSPTGGATGGPAGTVTVTEKEYSLGFSEMQLTPGSHTFVAHNAGTTDHALAISGPGVATMQTSPIPPGGDAQFTVTLQQGSYELWCPIDDHKALGMDAHVQVGAGGTGSPAPTGGATGATPPGNGY